MSNKDSEVEQLESRIEQLEELVSKMMPSRRDAIKLGGAAVLGGAAMSSRASAAGDQAGTIGRDAQNQRVDIESEDINNADTLTSNSITTQDLTVSNAVLSSLDLDNNDITGLDQLNGDALVTSGESNDFEVQKDGSDQSGVINFKT